MRLIDADAIPWIDLNGDITSSTKVLIAFADKVNRMPTIEPERKKGKWLITDAYPHNVHCSECHKKFAQTHWAVWEDGSLPRNYCPNCGADMRGERQ